LLNKGGCSLYFNYVKNTLNNTFVHEFQDVDYHSEDEQANDAITTTAINVLCSSSLQADPHVMRGLQEIIPDCRTDVTITNGGKKVSMLLAHARKQLKEGRRKSPPKQLPISKHTPPYSNFVSNVDSCAWCNSLSSKPMYLHQEARKMAVAVLMATMTERVQKWVLDVFLCASTTSMTKKIAAKVHAQLTPKDAAFMSIVNRFQDTQCSQEISSACLELQRAMD
jgi:hypothetical protein